MTLTKSCNDPAWVQVVATRVASVLSHTSVIRSVLDGLNIVLEYDVDGRTASVPASLTVSGHGIVPRLFENPSSLGLQTREEARGIRGSEQFRDMLRTLARSGGPGIGPELKRLRREARAAVSEREDERLEARKDALRTKLQAVVRETTHRWGMDEGLILDVLDAELKAMRVDRVHRS